MKSVVTTAPGAMTLELSDAPIPGPGEALIDVEAVGLCGSDLYIYGGVHPYLGFPVVQGHEVVGRVAALGPDTVGPALGTRVVIDPVEGCGTCQACLGGRENCCPDIRVLGVQRSGGLAEQLVVGADRLYDASDLPVAVAVAAEPLAVALHALGRAGEAVDRGVLVLGAGSIGRVVALAAADRGARVLVSDREGHRLDVVTRIPGALTVNARTHDLEDTVRDVFGPDGAPVVIDATGAPQMVMRGLDIVAPGGTVVIVGVSTQELHVPLSIFTRKELTVLGSRNSRGEFPAALDLARRHRDLLESWISHRFALDDAEAGLRFTRDHPSRVMKAIVDIRTAGGA